MNMGTEATPASTCNADLVGSQLHGLAVPASLKLDARVIAKKGKHLSGSEHRKLVASLQTRLKQSEADAEALRSREKQLLKRCKVQSKLVKHLREQLGDQEMQIAMLKKGRTTPIGTAHQDSRGMRGRVVSVNDALLRISGVELPDKPSIVPSGIVMQDVEAIDLEDLQDTELKPIVTDDLARVSGELRVMAVSASTTIRDKIKTRIENFDPTPYQLLVKRGLKFCQSAALEVQSGFKAK